jgi:hypothetical protein
MALPIPDYPGYLAYEDGRIWSNKTNKFLRPNSTRHGYQSVELFNENGGKRILIHRIVASIFIPNPNNLPQINHKDENPENNRIENLEWCTAKYNMNYGEGARTRHQKINYTKPIYAITARINGKAVSVPVSMYSKDGQFIKRFNSIADASKETHIAKSGIGRVARGERKTAGGCIWRREG